MLLMGAVCATIGERSAVIAGMLFALHPVAIFTTISMYSETLFLFLLCLLLYVMALAWRRQQSATASVLALAMWLTIGVVAGISTVVRVSMLYFAPLLMLLWVGFLPIPLRQRAACFFAALVGFVSPLLSWSIHNYQRFGSYRLSASGEYNLLVLTIGQAFAKGGLADFNRVKRELTTEALQRMHQDGLSPATQPLHRVCAIRYSPVVETASAAMGVDFCLGHALFHPQHRGSWQLALFPAGASVSIARLSVWALASRYRVGSTVQPTGLSVMKFPPLTQEASSLRRMGTTTRSTRRSKRWRISPCSAGTY